jgi:hypothetical protein
MLAYDSILILRARHRFRPDARAFTAHEFTPKDCPSGKIGGEIFEAVDRPYCDEHDILWLEPDALIASVEPPVPNEDNVKLVLRVGCLIINVLWSI